MDTRRGINIRTCVRTPAAKPPIREMATSVGARMDMWCRSRYVSGNSRMAVPRPVNGALSLGILLLGLAIAPAAEEPLRYLPSGGPDAAVVLSPPPLPGSPEQAADMAEVVANH